MVTGELNKGPEQLSEEVIGPGWCVACGACVELCPYIKAADDRVAVVQACSLESGNCYAVCPRTFTDYNDLAFKISSSEAAEMTPALGSFEEILQARSLLPEIRDKGQNGGVVSALMTAALEEGLVDAALLTASDGFYPRYTLARSKMEVLAAAGSKYGVYPGLAGLNRSLAVASENVAVVGRPCQVVALRKLQHYSSVRGRENLALVLGLFCFWGLDYRFYEDLRKHYQASRIGRCEIPKDRGLTLETDRGEIIFSLEETRAYVRRGCHSCADPTSELADLSIGSTESDPAWCTLLVRTRTGLSLLQKALSSKLIEVRSFPTEARKALEEAALDKKERVFKGRENDIPPVNNSYLKLTDQYRVQLAEGGGGAADD